jgi:hypothetical protein
MTVGILFAIEVLVTYFTFISCRLSTIRYTSLIVWMIACRIFDLVA